MNTKKLNVKIRTQARFDTRSHLRPRHERYLSTVASLYGATKSTSYDINGRIAERSMIERLQTQKQFRSVALSANRIAELENKVYKKALQLSSGNIPFGYMLLIKPYSRANPRPPLPPYIINDHSLEPTTPSWYRGRQFKRSWIIKARFKSKREGELVIENNARYSLYIRATERTNSKQMPRPIFSYLLDYAKQNL